VSSSNKFIFNSYGEYFRLTRPLSIFQRKRLFNDLCPSERDFLEDDFDKNGWEHLLIQNEINRRSDTIKKKYNKDLFLIRIKLVNNKKIKIKRSLWNHIVSTFADIPSVYLNPVLGGVVSRVDKNDPSFVVLRLDMEKDRE